MTLKNPLIPDPYDPAWTRLDGRDFHAYTTADQAASVAAADANARGNPDPTNEWDWLSRGSPIYLRAAGNATFIAQQPILLADNYRNLLIFQNTSVATSPDVAPTLFISVDGPVQLQAFPAGTVALNALTLAPGVGLLLDERVLTNAIYHAFAGGSGASSVGSGLCMFGRTPNSPPMPQFAGGGMITELSHQIPPWLMPGVAGK